MSPNVRPAFFGNDEAGVVEHLVCARREKVSPMWSIDWAGRAPARRLSAAARVAAASAGVDHPVRHR
jgi:hypothetical protein